MPSVSKKQHNLMAMVANDPKKAKQLGIPQSVGEEYVKADKGLKFGKGSKTRADLQKINRPKTNQGKMELFARGGEMKHDDVKMDKSMMQKAVNKHESRLHKGATPTKLAKGGVAKTVTKEMEYDYKTGKKSFAGSTAKRDAHAEKEGKRVAKDLAYDKAKGYAKGGYVKAADGIAQRGKTKGTEVTMCGGGMAKKK